MTDHLNALWSRIRLELMILSDGPVSNYDFADAPEGASGFLWCLDCGRSFGAQPAFVRHQTGKCAGSIPTTEKPRAVSHRSTVESVEPRPAGIELSELEYRWEGCRSDRDRRAVLLDALFTVKQHRIRRLKPDETRKTMEWRERIARDPRPAGVVAYAFAIRTAEVLKHRREFGVVVPVGRPRQAIR